MAEEGAKTGFYGALEGKYYDFLDWLESIGLPVYKLVDPLEERNIPTFPLAVLLALVLVGGLVFFIAPVFLQAESELSVLVQDENGDAVFGAQVKISLSDGEEIASLSTDSAGRAQASVPRGKEFLITASKEPDFLANSATKFVENKSETFSISLERKVVQLRKEIRLLRPGTNELIGKLVEVEARCSNDASFLETKSTSSGFISLDVPSNCGQLQI
ncbi:MAG: hypothetical protein HYW50_03675, partial [Candidatus Diapherotrites archaeon]|nr:hypothetical protein [Candidatus Diapherotrites archaeon]